MYAILSYYALYSLVGTVIVNNVSQNFEGKKTCVGSRTANSYQEPNKYFVGGKQMEFRKDTLDKQSFASLLPQLLEPIERVISKAMTGSYKLPDTLIDNLITREIFTLADLVQHTEEILDLLLGSNEKLKTLLVSYIHRNQLRLSMRFDDQQKMVLETTKALVDRYYIDESILMKPPREVVASREVAKEKLKSPLQREENKLCPHCKQPLKITVSVEPLIIQLAEKEPEWEKGCTPQEIQFIRGIKKETKALSVLEAMLKELKLPESVRSIESFFLNLLKRGTRITLSPHVRVAIEQSFEGKNILIIASGEISMVIVSNILKMFIPTELILGKHIKNEQGEKTNTRMMPDDGKIKEVFGNPTRYFGYIRGKEISYKEITRMFPK